MGSPARVSGGPTLGPRSAAARAGPALLGLGDAAGGLRRKRRRAARREGRKGESDPGTESSESGPGRRREANQDALSRRRSEKPSTGRAGEGRAGGYAAEVFSSELRK